MKNIISCLLAATIFLGAGLACEESNSNQASADKAGPKTTGTSKDTTKLDDYTIRGFRFVYFRIPAGLDRDKLIETAQKLHDAVPDAQLILVDDDARLKDYIKYVKALSGEGDIEDTDPVTDWADKHIIANVQKYASGKFVLCKGNGHEEIADLK